MESFNSIRFQNRHSPSEGRRLQEEGWTRGMLKDFQNSYLTGQRNGYLHPNNIPIIIIKL